MQVIFKKKEHPNENEYILYIHLYVYTYIFVSTFHSLNFVLSDQVADIEFNQTNEAMA